MCGIHKTGRVTVNTPIVLALLSLSYYLHHYLLGVVLVPCTWDRRTRDFIKSESGASLSLEQEGGYMGAHFSLPEIDP